MEQTLRSTGHILAVIIIIIIIIIIMFHRQVIRLGRGL